MDFEIFTIVPRECWFTHIREHLQADMGDFIYTVAELLTWSKTNVIYAANDPVPRNWSEFPDTRP
jgi:hypothetical protein